MLPYRAKLSGLLSSLYIFFLVCQFEEVNCGKVTIYCDNQAALDEVFATAWNTNNPYKYLQADLDLTHCARSLLLQLASRIKVKKEWVKGHYNGPDRKLKHDLNDNADIEAGSFNSIKRKHTHPQPILPPLYEAELSHNYYIITSNLQRIVTDSLHLVPIQQHIIKSANWDPSTINTIDWEAHKRAMGRYNRTQRIGITKLGPRIIPHQWKRQ
jgi:hypothetical protein